MGLKMRIFRGYFLCVFRGLFYGMKRAISKLKITLFFYNKNISFYLISSIRSFIYKCKHKKQEK